MPRNFFFKLGIALDLDLQHIFWSLQRCIISFFTVQTFHFHRIFLRFAHVPKDI